MAAPFLNELVEDVNKPLSIPSKLLGQAEGVGIDFYTINYLRMSMREIHIGSQGQRLYNHCLTNLPIHRSADPKFQFGWGEQHMLRNAGVQLFEYEHLLLSSALGEYLSEGYAAAVLSELAGRYEDEERPRPRMASLKGFVRCANGILATSEFPLVVDDRIRLNPYRLPSDGLPRAKQPQETLAPARIAEALCSLNGRSADRPDLVIAGGDVLGWFSAYADLCLGLDVTLIDEDGTELHRANPSDGWRLKLRFIRLDTVPDSRQLYLRDGATPASRPSIHTVIHSGRAMPQAIFNKAFGAAFHRLSHDEAKTFSNALGGLARNWELIATQEVGEAPADEVAHNVISPDNRSNPASWGMGLIQTWTNWFPELRHLQGRMERALKLERAAAGQQCEESILRLEPMCGCYICSSPSSSSSTSTTTLPKDGFCLPTLMETIVMLGLALSRVALTPNLYPSRAGVLAMYKSQVRKRLDLQKLAASPAASASASPSTHFSTIGPASSAPAPPASNDPTNHDWQRHVILFGSDWNSTFPKRIFNALALFAGSWPPTMNTYPENLVGLAHEGIAAYSMMLERGTVNGRHKDDQVIRVVTGAINWRQRTVGKVCVGPPQVVRSEEGIGAGTGKVVVVEGGPEGWERIRCRHMKKDLYVL